MAKDSKKLRKAYRQLCLWQLQDCDVTSTTGSGVGLEGGQLEVSRCRIHNCKQHGIALFKGLDGGDGELQAGPS